MKLNFDEIKALTVGALSFKEEKDALWFDHYTDETIERFANKEAFWHTGATCTTGVRLDFNTDADFVTLVVAGDGKYEILKDGLMLKSEKLAAGSELTAELGKGKKRLTIVLPSHSRGGIKKLKLENVTYTTKKRFDRKVLFIGDSITQGWNARFDSGSYAYITSFNLGADSLIQGVGGMVFEPDLFDNNDYEPDFIVVAYGCNDFSRWKTLDELKMNADRFLDKLCARYPAVKRFGIVPIWRHDAGVVKSMGTFDECRKVIEDSLFAHGFITVDGYKLVPHLTEYFADTVHPNDIGFAEMARNLTKFINKHIQ